MISQPDTADQALLIWRIQYNIDADVDALLEAQQVNLNDVLALTDVDSRDAIQRMDDVTFDGYTYINVNPQTRTNFAV